MLGNFIGDFVKGRNLVDQFGGAIAKGIELHREIDSFTDHHAVVLQSKTRLRPKYRHYAPVIVDVFYDHFLSKNWLHYHATPLPDFARMAYGILDEHQALLPEGVRQLLPHMVRGNWLVNYGELWGIERALTGLSRRTRHVSLMDESVVELEAFYDDFRQEFEAFFPELINMANTFLLPLEGPVFPLKN
nr:acyl carrier protein phosphodiesterase [Chryseolinea lacunae]